MTSLRRAIALVAAVGVSGAISAQNTQTPTPPNDERGRAQSTTPATPGTASPLPATRQTEGTAADRSVPGSTRTRSTDPGTANPMPATSPAEGTAADSTPPGETKVRGTAASQAPDRVTSQMRSGATSHSRGSELMGLGVQTPQGGSVGAVQDLIVDRSSGRITHVVVAGSGTNPSLVAVPWNAFEGMRQGQQVIMDESHFAKAPRFQRGMELTSNASWSADADRYWRTRTAGR